MSVTSMHKAVVLSTTGTAPIYLTAVRDGKVRIDLEDGSSQTYRADELRMALNRMPVHCPACGVNHHAVCCATAAAEPCPECGEARR